MSVSKRKINLEITSRLENVANVANQITQFCSQIGLDEMTVYQIETCIVEAVNNAIIHAYSRQPDKIVKILGRIDSNTLIIEVIDKGKTMQQMPANKPVSIEQESGRGWYIMRQWMDEADYESVDRVNCVRLKKRIIVN